VLSFFKRIVGIALTQNELLQQNEDLLRQVPLPADLDQAVHRLDGNIPGSFKNFVRTYYSTLLSEIGDRRSWGEQRAHLLKLAMQERTWRATFRVADKSNNPKAWCHLMGGEHSFNGAPEDHWMAKLTHRYVLALICSSWLDGLGSRCYSFDKVKLLELDLHHELNYEIKKLDVGFFWMLCSST
jgi:hypothetical protein